MITGRVLHRRPTLSLTVLGPNGQTGVYDALVDTGFSGFLTLPPNEVAALRLPFRNYYHAGLADGSRIRVEVYEATILWHDVTQTVFVLATGNEPLLGMSLIYGSRLTLEGMDDGVLHLHPLP